MDQRRRHEVYGALAIVLAVLFLWRTLYIDLIIFAGLLLAIFLFRLGELAARYLHLPRRWSLFLVVTILAGLAGGGTFLFANTVADQLDQLLRQLARSANAIEHFKALRWVGVASDGWRLQKLFPSGLVDHLLGVASNAAFLLGGVTVTAFVGLYVAAEPKPYEIGLISLFPPHSRGRVRQILRRAGDSLWYWTLGRLLSMTVVGIGTTAGLWGLGMPLPVALGVLAGVLTFVPYLGSLAASVPAIVLALSIGTNQAIYVLLLYMTVHVVEGYVLVPLVQRRASHLPPALILSCQMLLGAFAGVVGVTFATPIAAALLPIIRMAYVEDTLHSPAEPSGLMPAQTVRETGPA